MRRSAPAVLGLALLVAALSSEWLTTTTVHGAPAKINGWYPCHESIANPHTLAPADQPPFECAEVEVPLCHEGICESKKTINLFVKRLLAKKPMTPRKAMWFPQGGPGYASAGMETTMELFNQSTNMTVDMYTLDHRGTGRSNYLECQAAQAFAAGSPGGIDVNVEEFPNCIKDIMFQIDNHTEAFSVTSAAKDVEYIIDTLNGDDTEVFVYGGSYGTYWSERVMHLAPKQVKGYILDGVVDEKTATFTTWNENRRHAESRFVKLCEDDKFCSSKLSKEIKTHGNLTAAIRFLYKRLDSAAPGEDKCADLLREQSPYGAILSEELRNYLGGEIQNDPARVLVPALLHRLYICGPKDVVFLNNYFAKSKSETTTSETPAPPTTTDLVSSNSAFLSALIKASELWTTPSPSWEDAQKSFQQGLFSTHQYGDYDMICLLRGNLSDPMCDHLIDSNPEIEFTKLKTTPYLYKPDKYWKKYAPIPSHSSVMVINGGLDFQTPIEWGTAEFEGLHGGGGGKMMVTFETGVHCAGVSLQTASDRTFCGFHIISSYVLGGGDVSKVNTSCMDDLPAFDFADLSAITKKVDVETANELYDS